MLESNGMVGNFKFCNPTEVSFCLFQSCHVVECFLGGCVCVLRFRGVLDREVLVSSTSNELLHRFGTWDASALKDWGDSTGFNRVSTA